MALIKPLFFITPVSNTIPFNNQTNSFSAVNAQTAIEEANKCKFFAQFQQIGILNFSTYLYPWSDTSSGFSSVDTPVRRSGDNSTGYAFSESAPIICPFDGSIKKIIINAKGLAVSNGTPASIVNFNLEIWNVGFSGEGTKLGDVVFPIPTTINPVGPFYDSSIDTNYKGSLNLNLSIQAGTLLALKFISMDGSSNVVQMKNVTASLKIVES